MKIHLRNKCLVALFGGKLKFSENLKVGGTRIGPIIMKGLTSKFLFPYSCTYQTFVIDETIWK